MTVDELMVLRLLDDKAAEKRYMDALVSSYVEDNPAIRWCPAPGNLHVSIIKLLTCQGCSNAILLKEVNQEHNEEVTCKCGMTF